MDNNNDLLYWKLGQMNAAKGYAAAAKGKPSGVALNAETATYIAGLTTPLSAGQVTLIDTFVTSLKTGLSITNLSDAFDIMYILAGETQESSLKNLVKNAHHCTSSAMPTFTTLEGFKGNGSSQFLDTNYNPNTQSVNPLATSTAFGIYSRTDVNEVSCDMGNYDSDDTNKTYILTRLSNVFYGTNRTDTDYGVANTDSRGFHVSSRTANNLTTLYRNSSPLGSSNAAGLVFSSCNMGILVRINSIGSKDIYSTRQLSFAFMGRGLSEAEVVVLKNAIEAYMDANGKGVIS